MEELIRIVFGFIIAWVWYRIGYRKGKADGIKYAVDEVKKVLP